MQLLITNNSYVGDNLSRGNYDTLGEVSCHSWLGLLMSLPGGRCKTTALARFLRYRETGGCGERPPKTRAQKKKKKQKKKKEKKKKKKQQQKHQRNRLVKEPKVRRAWLRRRRV